MPRLDSNGQKKLEELVHAGFVESDLRQAVILGVKDGQAILPAANNFGELVMKLIDQLNGADRIGELIEALCGGNQDEVWRTSARGLLVVAGPVPGAAPGEVYTPDSVLCRQLRMLQWAQFCDLAVKLGIEAAQFSERDSAADREIDFRAQAKLRQLSSDQIAAALAGILKDRALEGVERLAQFGRDPLSQQSVKDALEGFTPELEKMQEAIGVLQACKNAHDVLLHRIGPKLGALRQALSDPQARGGLNTILLDMDGLAARLITLTEKCGAGKQQLLVDAKELVDGFKAIQSEAANPDGDPLAMLPSVESAVAQTPGKYQSALMRTAGELTFKKFADALNNSSLPTGPGGELEGIGALVPLGNSLQQLIREHEGWQRLDPNVRRLAIAGEALDRGDDTQFREVRAMTKRVVTGMAEMPGWTGGAPSARVQQTVEALSTAVAAVPVQGSVPPAALKAVSSACGNVRAIVDQVFGDVDSRLLSVCEDVARLSGPLRGIVKVLHSK